MNEKLMQDLLKAYPDEFIEDGLIYHNREITTGNRRIDLAFTDKRGRLLLVEVQIGSLDTKHIDRHIDFIEGYIDRNPEVDLRLMYIANKIDPLRKTFLERRGYEYLEIPAVKFLDIAKKYSIFTNEPVLQAENVSTDDRIFNIPNTPADDNVKREKFILCAKTLKEKEFWRCFFEEIDKRSFVRAKFQAAEFGVHIHNTKHFSSSGGKYSLMYTRNSSFKMNDTAHQNKSWNGLNRLKNWCITPNLPEHFYSSLKSKNLIIGMDVIDIPKIVNSSTPKQVLDDLFNCIDLFR